MVVFIAKPWLSRLNVKRPCVVLFSIDCNYLFVVDIDDVIQ